MLLYLKEDLGRVAVLLSTGADDHDRQGHAA
jgi:hypothetical protein